MRTGFTRLVLAAALAGSFALAAEGARAADGRIATGFEIAPVPLNLQGLDRARVGLGSYIATPQATATVATRRTSISTGTIRSWASRQRSTASTTWPAAGLSARSSRQTSRPTATTCRVG